jgi:DNA-nicking Smr family endonuclease
MAKEKPFNNPFAAVKLKKDEPKPAPAAPARGPGSPGGKKPPPPPAKKKAEAPGPDLDAESMMFLNSVGEVEPVRATSKKADIQKPPPAPRGSDTDEETLLQLSELVAGLSTFDLADSDEYIEGATTGLDAQILRKLRRGDYAVQAQLDLHGLLKADAKVQLETFLTASQAKSFRCVLVIHGRGLHSEDQIPVLKESVQSWLTRGRMSKQVLAFTTAQSHDGGPGAVYVLLRR